MLKELIQKIDSDFSDSKEFLEQNYKVSERNNLEVLQTKVSILTLGTYVENRTYEIIQEFLNSHKDSLLYEFLENHALNRKFHTMFDFRSNNLNKFFGLFGDEFCDFMKTKTKIDEDFKNSISAFLEICVKRNTLAHENFYLTSIDLTLEEVYKKAENIELFYQKFQVYSAEFQTKNTSA
ncbi:HEPN domain-containing protein [Leptospira sp. WS39.C2]